MRRALAAGGSRTARHYLSATDEFKNRPLAWEGVPRAVSSALAQCCGGHCSRATGIWGGVEFLDNNTCPRCDAPDTAGIEHLLFGLCPGLQEARGALNGLPRRKDREKPPWRKDCDSDYHLPSSRVSPASPQGVICETRPGCGRVQDG